MMGLLKKRRIILGIDPGYGITGFGVVKFVGDKPEPLDYGCITTPKDEDLGIRLSMIQEDLFYLLEKYRPDIVAIENLYFCKNVKTAIDVGQARGISILACSENNIKIFEYTPLQVKEAIVGYGRATKLQIKYMLKAILGVEDNFFPKEDDAWDAMAIAICHANNYKFENKIKELVE